MAQNNDGPGKRLKREEAKNTLYVSKPNDPRLRAYQDSLALHNYSEQQSKIEGIKPPPQYWGPNSRSGNRSKITPNLNDRIKNYKSDWEEAEKHGHSLVPHYGTLANYTQKQEELFKTTKKLVDTNKNIEYYNNLSSPDIIHKTIKPIGFYTGSGVNDIYKKPERPVVYREPAPKPKPKPVPVITRTVSKIVEPLTPRQAPSPILTREEIIAPVPRPVPQSNIEPQDGPIGFALRYPAQTLMNRVKARITGNPNMPYWVDREGVKRYPSMGENSPEEVRMMETLRGGLDSNSPEDVSELKRIEMLRKMSPKDRRKYMDSERIAQE